MYKARNTFPANFNCILTVLYTCAQVKIIKIVTIETAGNERQKYRKTTKELKQQSYHRKIDVKNKEMKNKNILQSKSTNEEQTYQVGN